MAVKQLKESQQIDAPKFLEEAAIMKRLRHSRLVPLYGVCTKQQPYYIVTELMVHGDLRGYLKKDGGRQIKLQHLIDIASQVCLIALLYWVRFCFTAVLIILCFAVLLIVTFTFIFCRYLLYCYFNF